MPLDKPTLAEIKSRQVADVQSSLELSELLPSSYLRSLSDALGGSVYLLYGFLEQMARQGIPSLAEGEFLTNWANTWKLTRNSATFASGNVTFTGNNGVQIPSGTNIISESNISYKTKTTVTIVSGTATVEVIALTAGAAGNLASSSSLSIINPIAGINSAATTAGLAGGGDTETDESLRARLLQRIQNAPQGGSKTDYERWALEVAGVGAVWVIEPNVAGSVYVYIVTPDEDNLAPSAALVQQVQDYIDDFARRPVTANVTVFAPTVVSQNFTINLSPNTAEIRAAVEANLEDLLKRERLPGGTLLISKIREAVSTAAGENDNSVTSPSGNVSLSTGQIAKLGTVTFTGT